MDDLEFNVEIVADGLAVGGPGVGSGLQAVVDMDGAQRGGRVVAGVFGQQVQEDGGIEPPEKATCQVGALSQGVRLII